jgi:hypothetical protein
MIECDIIIACTNASRLYKKQTTIQLGVFFNKSE